MSKIIMLIGPPNSGKTTWTREFIKKNKEYVKVSRDDFRRMFFDEWVVSRDMENILTNIQNTVVDKFLDSGVNVILDNTHCKQQYIDAIIERYGSKHDIIYKVFDVDRHTLMARNEYRGKIDGKYIPDTVMENMIKNFNKLKETFTFKDIVH
jgi:predicted kinase